MAKHADKFALVRSVYHTGAGVHDTGHQMMQTGRLFQAAIEHPHVGCVLGKLKGPKGDVPPHVLLPRPIGNTGGNLPHGQIAGLPRQDLRSVRPERRSVGAGFQGAAICCRRTTCRRSASTAARRCAKLVDRAVSHLEAAPDARLLDSNFQPAYRLMSSADGARGVRPVGGRPTRPGPLRPQPLRQSCLLARRLIERGVRFVTVNMFETVFNEITWDIHGSAPFSPISCYRDLVGPMFDQAYSSLLEDLDDRGLLQNTMVLAIGRVRPHAEDQPRRRPRPLAATAGRC